MQAPELLRPLAEFATEHVLSWDIDPVYPVLKHLVVTWELEREGPFLDEERALWQVLTYVAFYNIASSETYFDEPSPEKLRLPTGTERRSLRGGAPMEQHLRALSDAAHEHGSLRGWLYSQGRDWDSVRVAVELVWGNGRWASYKTAEVLQKVLDWPLVATDMGNYGSSGPRWTLNKLYDLPEGNSLHAINAADAAAEDLLVRLADEGVPLTIEQLETVLCDFGSTMKGHFYVGHDIDKMLEQTLHPSVPEAVRARIWEARAATLPHAYLGELNGWRGVDKELCYLYKLTGEVTTRAQWSSLR